jgi:hypothetical protein
MPVAIPPDLHLTLSSRRHEALLKTMMRLVKDRDIGKEMIAPKPTSADFIRICFARRRCRSWGG